MIKVPFASTRFECVQESGESFVAEAIFHDIEEIELDNGITVSRLSISFEPFFTIDSISGVDSMHAICIGLELFRKAFRTHAERGGKIFYPGGRVSVEIESWGIIRID